MFKGTRIVVIAALLLLVLALCVLSVAESSTYHECISKVEPQPGSQPQNEHTPQIFMGSIVIKCLGVFVDENDAAITAISTAVIAIFTTVLGVFTISLAKSTRVAANAANLSARAAIALELPIIRANAGKLGYGTSQDEKGQQPHVWVSDLTLSNLGRTKAFPIEVQIGCTIGDRLPKIPVYRFTKSCPTNAILASAPQPATEISLREFDFEAPPDIYDRLRTRSTSLWFYCNLIYLDFMQTRHESCFCWKCHETSGMGILLDDPTPAYNRKT
jgi:hypothetical protein